MDKDKVIFLRERLGLTQKEYADLLGLTRPAISQIESGRRSGSIKMVKRIADFHKVSIDWLLGRDQNLYSEEFIKWARAVTGEIHRTSPMAFHDCDLSWLAGVDNA